MADRDLARHLGAMLEAADLEDPFEYRFMFDLCGVTFLQKLIPKRILEAKLNLAPEGFFRILLVLDFFTTVVAGEDAVLGNLRTLYKRLLKKDGYKTPIPEGLVVVEVGLYAKEKGLPPDLATAQRRTVARRGKKEKEAEERAGASPRLFYEGMGYLLADQLLEKTGAERIEGKADYEAAVFAGAVLTHGGAGKARVLELMRQGDFLEAALESLRAYADCVRLEDVERYVP